MKVKTGLLYSEGHTWLQITGGKARIGLTDQAQCELGRIVFINLPLVGDKVAAGAIFCDLESTEAVSDIYSPASGIISTVNEELDDTPSLLNKDCYGTWICELSELGDTGHLMDAAAYKTFLAQQK